MIGQTARYERYIANMATLVASDRRLDYQKAEGFGEQVDRVYSNPFTKPKETPMTRKEIEDYIVKRLTE